MLCMALGYVDPLHSIAHLEDRLRTLSGALRAFAEATTHYDVLLEVVARTLSQVVKDGCVVRLLEDNGTLPAAAIHLPCETPVSDPMMRERVRAHVASPQQQSAHSAGRQVLETGVALLVPHLDLAQLRESAAPAVAEAYEQIGIHSLL